MLGSPVSSAFKILHICYMLNVGFYAVSGNYKMKGEVNVVQKS